MSIRKGNFLIASGSSLDLTNYYTKLQTDDAISAANDTAVHKTGNETIAGVKTFTDTIYGTITTALWAEILKIKRCTLEKRLKTKTVQEAFEKEIDKNKSHPKTFEEWSK